MRSNREGRGFETKFDGVNPSSRYISFLGSKLSHKASENPEERLKKHNAKNKGFTNRSNDWQIVFLKSFETKSEALAYEKLIKSWKSSLKIQKLISSAAGLEHPDA